MTRCESYLYNIFEELKSKYELFFFMTFLWTKNLGIVLCRIQTEQSTHHIQNGREFYLLWMVLEDSFDNISIWHKETSNLVWPTFFGILVFRH
jgi:hypothetical protein